VRSIVSAHGDEGNVVDLDAERRRREPVRLSRAEIEAFSAALALAEPRSRDYWNVVGYYLRAVGEDWT
jgi:hypothetical protein